MSTETKTPAQRKADERRRYRDKGLVVMNIWVNPLDRENVWRYIKRLNERRARA